MSTTPNDIHSATSSRPMDAAKPTSDQDALRLRLKKIDEYADQALAKSDALEAIPGLVASVLTEIILGLRHDIQHARAVMQDPLDSLGIRLQISEQVYKLSKQLYAYIELITRLKKSHTGGKSNRSKKKLHLKPKPK